MVKRQRRHSQNSQLMRRILAILREYDGEEIRALCLKYRRQSRVLSSASQRRKAAEKRVGKRPSAPQ